MEKGRSVGSYFLFVVREGLYRLKTELFGWRGFVMILIGGYMILDTFEGINESDTLMFQGIAALWLVLLFPPRMGKLLYLLPFSKKERVRYLGTYSVSYLMFLVMLFLLVGIVAFFASGYSIFLWMRHFLLCTFPFLMLYSGTVIDSLSIAVRRSYPNSGWFFSTRGWWQQKPDPVEEIREDCTGTVNATKKNMMSAEEKENAKKQTRFTICLVFCTIIPAIQCCVSYTYMELCKRAPWTLYLFTVLAYISAAIGLYLYWSRISDEMNKKGSVGKGDDVCSL